VTNYIPISLLNNSSKVFEIIIHDHLSITLYQNYSHLNTDLLHRNQL
jgi:hypothetical protein